MRSATASAGRNPLRATLIRCAWLGAGVAVLVVGWQVGLWKGRVADRQMRGALLSQAKTIAATIHPEAARSLAFTTADCDSHRFQQLSQQLKGYRSLARCRGIYTIAQRGDRLVFGPESYDPDDQMASVPGTVYQRPSPQTHRIFATGEAFTQGPWTDEFGTFVSAMAPVLDPDDGRVIMIVGLDVEAHQWQASVAADRARPILAALAVVILAAAVARTARWYRRDWPARPGKDEQRRTDPTLDDPAERRSAQVVVGIGLVAVAFLCVVLLQTWYWTREHTARTADNETQMAIGFSRALRHYAGQKIRPEMERRIADGEFVLETMSTSFIARNVFEAMREEFPGAVLRFPSTNPRNPVNTALPAEKWLIRHFEQYPAADSWSGTMQFFESGETFLVRAVPRRFEASCLQCHGDPADAPAAMLEQYGSTAGFGRREGEVSLDLVAVPVEAAQAVTAWLVWRHMLGALVLCAGMLAGIGAFVHRDIRRRRRLASALWERNERLQALNAQLDAQRMAMAAATRDMRTLLDGLPAYAFLKDRDGRYLAANQKLCEALGRGQDRIVGRTDAELFPPDLARRYTEDDRQILCGSVAALDREEQTVDGGQRRWVLTRKLPLRGPDGRIDRLIGMAFDITDLREAQAKVRHLSRAVEQMPASIIITDIQGNIEYVNEAFTLATGYTADEVRGRNPRILKSGLVAPEEYRRMWQALTTGRDWRGEIQNRRKNGELFWELAIVCPLTDGDGQTTHYLAITEDITARKQMEAELRTAARTDKLTGLTNRALFCDRLQQAILRARRLRDYHFAVLFLDFDRFKLINDSLGHETGDLLLRQIAQRIRAVVRSGDSLSCDAREHTSARLGGDEFVVLLDGIRGADDACTVADRLLEAFAEPYRLGKHEVYSTASIGIVTSEVAAASAEEVLRDADTAMYEAKLAGKGRYVLFDVSMRHRVQNRLNLENDLRRAIEGGQLFLCYQPIVSLESGEVESFEALVRWRHPQRGLISPAEFIPIAEDTGLIVPIGEWVLREACRQCAQWHGQDGQASLFSVSVNLSRNQLLLPGLAETVRQVLEETGLPPDCLHLEITESAVTREVEQATRLLHAIKALGVKLDLDDFGTGYSSLSCLHQFPLDVLKIDRSFIANIERGRDFAALIHAVALLARNLGISVVAEGIETVEQLAVLQSLECEFGQGYLFAPPLPPEQVPGFRLQPGLLAEAVSPG